MTLVLLQTESHSKMHSPSGGRYLHQSINLVIHAFHCRRLYASESDGCLRNLRSYWGERNWVCQTPDNVPLNVDVSTG